MYQQNEYNITFDEHDSIIILDKILYKKAILDY
jgi:hypothetical protein